MRHHARQLAGDGAVDIFYDGEVCGEEDVEVALLDLDKAVSMNLWIILSEAVVMVVMAYVGSRNRHNTPLIPRLHNRRIIPLNSIRQCVKITSQKLMQRKVFPQDIEKLH